MKKLFLLLALAVTSLMAAAQDKMIFVIEGPEQTYNQIRVINETSMDEIHCRVVVLDDSNQIKSEYGQYNVIGKGKWDSNTDRISRGTRLGIQMPQNFEGELAFTIEYKDYPFFDAILIHLTDKADGFSSEM